MLKARSISASAIDPICCTRVKIGGTVHDRGSMMASQVVGNDRGYLWILSRTPQLAESVKAGLVAQADRLGFDTGKLVWVPQEQAIRGQISSGAHRRS